MFWIEFDVVWVFLREDDFDLERFKLVEFLVELLSSFSLLMINICIHKYNIYFHLALFLVFRNANSNYWNYMNLLNEFF